MNLSAWRFKWGKYWANQILLSSNHLNCFWLHIINQNVFRTLNFELNLMGHHVLTYPWKWSADFLLAYTVFWPTQDLFCEVLCIYCFLTYYIFSECVFWPTQIYWIFADYVFWPTQRFWLFTDCVFWPTLWFWIFADCVFWPTL